MIFFNPGGAPELACNECGCRWYDRLTNTCYECGEKVSEEEILLYKAAMDKLTTKKSAALGHPCQSCLFAVHGGHDTGTSMFLVCGTRTSMFVGSQESVVRMRERFIISMAS